ncbi:MAG: aminodeoxychorismate/anthranilate synthase component II [Legionellales bacterium RIFCSPHIGHO2_12_FULL_42_9]|nr:MAG: aminodeoxychorismate/anthranilate synthase component II [Legionellales bacterium RIFCSPHIGHO2_12_FULL_42_9]
MILIIDNYDSFTYNLVHYFEQLAQEVRVFYHDAVTVDEISRLAPSHLVLSPGPKGPLDAGISIEAIHHFYQTLPILGICLGHQCLAHAFGAQIIKAPEIIHGKTSPIIHNKQRLFRGLPSPFQATRYHSLAVECASLSDCFSIDAWANDTIMAISHRQYPVFGLQFHPEAILTEHGLALLNNFLNYTLDSAVFNT